MNILAKTIQILNSIPNSRTSFGSTYEIIPQLEELKLVLAKRDWQSFSETLIDEEGGLLDNFTVLQGTEREFTFISGTHREDIWNWFEEEYHISVHDDLMFPEKK